MSYLSYSSCQLTSGHPSHRFDLINDVEDKDLSGVRIKWFRDKNNFSQRDLADLLGVSVRSVARWEQNKCKPYPDEMKGITKITGITEAELLSDDDTECEPRRTVVDKISDEVDNLVSGQEMINESLNTNHKDLIKELQTRNEQLATIIDSYKVALDTSRQDLHQKRIRTIAIVITCILILVLIFGTWLYWRNHGFDGKVIEGTAEMGTPSYYQVDDGI